MSRFTGFLLLCACFSAHATSCVGPITVCSSFTASSVVFLGRILEAKPWPARCDLQTSPDGRNATGCWAPQAEDFRFEVLEVFKGTPGQEITVTGTNQQFDQGEQYLVFAVLNSTMQNAHTGFCIDNHRVADPNVDPDVGWLRAYPTAPPTTRIFGTISMGYGASNVPSVAIELSGDRNLGTNSLEDHTYEFKDLPPGTYGVTVIAPTGYALLDRDPATVTVPAKGCAEIDWSIRLDTHIKGTVIESSGKPAAEAHIGLLHPVENRIGFDIVTSQYTDANGHYDFSKIQPGDYWVALYYLGPNSSEPHTPVFYPSGDNTSSAKLIHLDASADIDNIDLVLTPALHPVNLHVHVANPDGSPVIRANVIASDPLTPTHAISATVDENGDADIILYEGREYRLTGSISGNREPACGGPVKFIAKEGLQLGTLTLDKSWHECRALQKAH